MLIFFFKNKEFLKANYHINLIISIIIYKKEALRITIITVLKYFLIE